MTVLHSINSSDGHLCVDVFDRPDGTFGFEEFRRDFEDKSGWFAIGGHIDRVFSSTEDALDAAVNDVVWFTGI